MNNSTYGQSFIKLLFKKIKKRNCILVAPLITLPTQYFIVHHYFIIYYLSTITIQYSLYNIILGILSLDNCLINGVFRKGHIKQL